MINILIIMGHYFPGYKDGGPVRSICNLTDRLGEKYNFYILTQDRDQGDARAYTNIKHGEWNQVGNAQVWYVEPENLKKEVIQKCAENKDIVYLCGCFNNYARIAMRLKKKNKISGRLIIASMGLFSEGSFHTKYYKKKIYVELLKCLKYFEKTEWSATGEKEVAEIHKVIGKRATCHIAEDIPQTITGVIVREKNENEPLRVVSLSRISPEKNLAYALEVIKNIQGKLVFDVYGTKEDEVYYETCERLMNELPENIECNYCGNVRPEKVIEVFSKYDVFLFPTKGENYGHVIFEALAGGCIPIISDQTPWNEIGNRNVGWVIPLSHKAKYIETVQKLSEMSTEGIMNQKKRVEEYILDYNNKIDGQGYKKMFGE